jgi:hypothetical protein
MIPANYIDLMNREIDGANTDEESRNLQRYLAESPEAAAHYQELREAVAVIGDVPSLDPPAGLRQRILAAVDGLPAPDPQARPVATERRPAGLESSWRRFWRRPEGRLAFAAGFAAALLLMVVIWQVSSPLQPVPADDLRGAILRQVAAGQGARGEQVTASLEGVSLTAQAQRAGARTLIQFTVAGEAPVTVRLVAAAPIDCASFRADPPAPVAVVAVDAQITMTFPGAGAYELVLQHAASEPPDIELQLIEGATVRLRQSMTRGIN